MAEKEPGPGVMYRGARYNLGQEGQYGSMGGYDIEGTRPPSDKSLLRGAMKPPEYDEASQVNMCELVLLPWFLLALVMLCYLIAGANGQIAVLWIMPSVLLLITYYIGTKYSLGDSDEAQIRPGGSVLDLIPTSPTWTAMQRPDTENIGLTRQRSGSPGPDPSTTQNARPRPMPLQHVVTAAVTTALPLGQVSPVGQCPPSPAFTRQISPPGSPAFTRQFSPPGSPAWTTVSNQKRKPGPGGAPVVRTGPAVPQEPVLQRLHTTGDSVDMYYDQKEMFTKGWTKEAKGTRSVKQKKRVDYQVEKRRQQSARDRGVVEDDFDDFLLDAE